MILNNSDLERLHNDGLLDIHQQVMMQNSSNEDEKLDMMLNEPKVKHGSKLSKERLIMLAVLAVGIISLIVGIVLIVIASADRDKNSTKHEEQTSPTSSPMPPMTTCSLSRGAEYGTS